MQTEPAMTEEDHERVQQAIYAWQDFMDVMREDFGDKAAISAFFLIAVAIRDELGEQEQVH